MKARWMAIGAVVGLVLALTIGFAYGSTGVGASTGGSGWWATMDAMHDSPWMEQMRGGMGPRWGAECDRLHEQMRSAVSATDRDRLRQHMTDAMREHMSEVGVFRPGGMMGERGSGLGGYGPEGMMGGTGSAPGDMMGG
ncbi:MAG: hypothetical protein ACE14W_11880 [Candidatus Velamenicoccus archaeovorus]